jgi:signal transduction histidine kinase
VVGGLTPVPGEDGKPRQLVGTLLDITDRKRAEEEREALRAKLDQAQKMESIGRLAGGVAHDFNNLLTAILCYAELGMLRANDPRMKDYLQQIVDAAGRGARLTGQLLAFARRQVLEPRVIDLNELTSHAADMLRRLIGEDVELVWIPGRALGRVKADPGQIEQILVNLVVNARDALPGGGRLTIETDNATLTADQAGERAEVTPGEYVMLAVTDTGAGIAPETLAMIFEPFFTTKEAGKGTGLGLATCYGIVKQHRGHIAVSSEPGRGTTFRVYLPRVLEPPAQREPRPEPGEAATGSETILVVEDYPPIRAMVREILSSLGYHVLTASDGEDALRASRAHDGIVHLLVTDVVMPRLGGKDLAVILGKERPGLRVLYTSGYTEDAIVQHGVLKPGVAFIAKPYRPGDIADKVRAVLDAP